MPHEPELCQCPNCVSAGWMEYKKGISDETHQLDQLKLQRFTD